MTETQKEILNFFYDAGALYSVAGRDLFSVV